MAKKDLFGGPLSKRSTKIGNTGYDNPRENIDPHIKTKAINTKEQVISKDLVFDDVGRIKWTKITANSITLIAGSSTNTVTDLQVHDGTFYHLDEVAATPGQDLIIDFINVKAFNWIKILGWYEGQTSHAISVKLYDWINAIWLDFDCMCTCIRESNHSFFVPNDTNFIGTGANKGQVRIQFIHEMAGNASHDLFLDVVALYQ